MGLFGKNQKKGGAKKNVSEPKKIQKLPELPDLPDFEEGAPRSSFEESKDEKQLSQLPRFPTNSLGEKFSQDTIKEAITGEKEGEAFGADEFGLEKEQMMLQPLEKLGPRATEPIPPTFREAARTVKAREPIFIRIDKFEESLNSFEKAKQQVSEIEKMLRDVKKIKEEEERELSAWEKEIQTTKHEIERIDQDIFSKVE